MTEALPRADLACNEGGSDKEYHCWIEPLDGLYIVRYLHGPRGRATQTGCKPVADAKTRAPKPVPRAQAQRVYDDIIKEKLAKQYKPMNGGPAIAYTSPSGMTRPDDSMALQALLKVDDPTLFIAKDEWVAQPKYDGRRQLLKLASGVVCGQNPKGLTVPVPYETIRLLGPEDLVLDGEAISPECYFVFDVLRVDGVDQRGNPYSARLETITKLLKRTDTGALRLARTAVGREQKQALYAELKAAKAEGIVFKHLDGKYEGRRVETMRKLKFWKEAQVLVYARNDTGEIFFDAPITYKKRRTKEQKRSIQAALISDGTLVFVGDVSVPVNYEMPTKACIAQVRYLYAYPATDIMFQPQYEGERDDVEIEDCKLAQLGYKRAEEE